MRGRAPRSGQAADAYRFVAHPQGARSDLESNLPRTFPEPSSNLPRTILKERGANAKASLKHSFSRASLDDALTPTRGSLIKVVTEVAGLGGLGDAAFVKHTLDAAKHVPILPGGAFTLSAAARAGLLLPLTAAPRATCVLDRFHLGSTNLPRTFHEPSRCVLDRFHLGGADAAAASLWGFRSRGAGPRATRHTHDGVLTPSTPRDALGGDVLGVASVALSTRLPGALGARGVSAQLIGFHEPSTNLPRTFPEPSRCARRERSADRLRGRAPTPLDDDIDHALKFTAHTHTHMCVCVHACMYAQAH